MDCFIYTRKRYGEQVVEDLNAALIEKLQEKAILKHRKLRTDTTVVDSDIHHPTDATLLQDGVKVLRRRTRESWEEVDRIIQSVIDMTETVVSNVNAVVEKIQDKSKAAAQQSKRRLTDAITRTGKLLDQAKQVVSGNRIIADRIVSFFNPEARPIKKGKLSKGTEFGYKTRSTKRKAALSPVMLCRSVAFPGYFMTTRD